MRRVLFWLVAGSSIASILVVLVTLGLSALRGASSDGLAGVIDGIASYYRYFLAPAVDTATSIPVLGALIVLALLLYAIAMAYLAQSQLEKRIAIGLVPLAIVSFPISGILAVYLLLGPFIMSP